MLLMNHFFPSLHSQTDSRNFRQGIFIVHFIPRGNSMCKDKAFKKEHHKKKFKYANRNHTVKSKNKEKTISGCVHFNS